MMSALGEVILRQAPEALRGGLGTGDYKIFGSIIKSTVTGRIVGHLQEAGALGSILTPALSDGVPIVGLGLKAAGLAQGEIIRRGVVELQAQVAAVASLGVANLAVSAAGLGLTAVGFTVISMKINEVKREVGRMGAKLDNLSDQMSQLRRDFIDADFSEVEAIAKSYDEAWHLSGPAALVRWHDVAKAALSYQTRFELRADRLLNTGGGHAEVVDPLLDAVSLTNSLRVSSLTACEELVAAQTAALDGGRTMERLTGSIGLADLSRSARSTGSPPVGTPRWALTHAKANRASEALARKIRAREAAAWTIGAPVAQLARAGGSGRRWLEAARNETTVPVIFLPAAG
ncbi:MULTISPECIES: hypothetical protein [Brevundimonas]|uniref:hypothetical protein n=1 Tax=Brevundimonas TaxID=41275 RepID=UPI0025B9DD40|nr:MULTISPECIES: hypothetical protein [Brevundimonas]